jgi:serine/threonine protein kinase
MTFEDHIRPSGMIGQLLGGGRYRIVRPLGEGGMGAVFEAEHLWTHRRVAIKLLLGHLATDPAVMQRFLREARAATALRHPNIVEVLDMGEEDGRLFMVQELLQGRSLAEELAQHTRLPPQAALDYLLPVMGALVHAHQQGIFHRDIKPDNIFLARERSGVVPKVIDFGIAKIRVQDDAIRTATGSVMGTPAYMAPEQVMGTGVDERMDVWAVGAVLFELLSGQLPFDGPSASAMMVRIVTEQAPALERVAPWVPRPLGACVDRALQRDRDARHPSMRAFLAALLDCPAQVPELDGAHLRTLADRSISGEQTAPQRARVRDTMDNATTLPTPHGRDVLGHAHTVDVTADDPTGVLDTDDPTRVLETDEPTGVVPTRGGPVGVVPMPTMERGGAPVARTLDPVAAGNMPTIVAPRSRTPQMALAVVVAVVMVAVGMLGLRGQRTVSAPVVASTPAVVPPPAIVVAPVPAAPMPTAPVVTAPVVAAPVVAAPVVAAPMVAAAVPVLAAPVAEPAVAVAVDAGVLPREVAVAPTPTPTRRVVIRRVRPARAGGNGLVCTASGCVPAAPDF